MKKVFIVCVLMALSLSVSAQLAWDTEFAQSDFNNALNTSPYSDECVVALPQVGIAEKLYFSWQGASNGTITIYQSPDHNNWQQIFSAEGNTIATAKADSAILSTSTRYIKFAASGFTAAAISKIRVSELKSLSVGLEEWEPAAAMVDDPVATKNVTVSWTNIVASVTSTDPHFSASVETVGQKNLIDQKTTITLFYSHEEAGSHSGEIIISGEGREARIAVSGTTSKYDQTLAWPQTLTECIATDELSFNAYASSGLEVVYQTSDPAIAEVEGNVLRIHSSGTITITATQPGNYKYNAANSEQKTLVIHKADPTISLSVDDITYGQHLSEAVLHELIGAVPGTLTWLNIDADTLLNADIIAPERLRMDTYSAVENRTETQLLDIWVEKSVLEKKIARANMRPILLAGATANYSKLLANGQTKAIGFLTVQMPLSAFWSERRVYNWKKIEEQKALDFRQDKRELITLQIQDAYDNLESTYKQTQIASKSIVRAEENLRINREHYRAGLTNMTVLLDAQRQQQQALTQYNSAVSEYLQAKTRYLILTGRRTYRQ